MQTWGPIGDMNHLHDSTIAPLPQNHGNHPLTPPSITASLTSSPGTSKPAPSLHHPTGGITPVSQSSFLFSRLLSPCSGWGVCASVWQLSPCRRGGRGSSAAGSSPGRPKWIRGFEQQTAPRQSWILFKAATCGYKCTFCLQLPRQKFHTSFIAFNPSLLPAPQPNPRWMGC